MTMLDSANGYRHAYNDYEDEFDPRELHPQVKRRAQKIVQKERLTRLNQWWVSLVGVLCIAGVISSTLLTMFQLAAYGTAVSIVSSLLIAYIVSLALRPFAQM